MKGEGCRLLFSSGLRLGASGNRVFFREYLVKPRENEKTRFLWLHVKTAYARNDDK